MKTTPNNTDELSSRSHRTFQILMPRNSTLGLAVSGGSDSMALLMLAAEFGAREGVTIETATVDHGLRPEAAEEARIVKDVCRKLGVAHTTLRWERTTKGPVGQDEARRARHGLLAQWAKRAGVGVVALGHTRDDRLETFLMRVRQGSGWHGLAGLLPNGYSPVWPEGRGLKVTRPLLVFGRGELREELRRRGMAWIDDPSNDETRYERVRMRRLLERMDVGAQRQALKIMDGLLAMRLSVVSEARALLDQTGTEEGVARFPLARREKAGAEAWFRFVEALVMAAGGGPGPPRREAMERLLARIAAKDPALERGVTLAGASIRLRKDQLVLTQAPPRRGEATRPPADWARADQLLSLPDLRMLAV
jgi:tRNA(Ile)-lysidine synthase